KILITLCLSFSLLLTSCSLGSGNSSTPTPELPTSTPEPPTPTPQPMAVVVNGEGVPLVEYQASLLQYQQALAAGGQTQSDADQQEAVLQDLVNQTLLSQGAEEQGYTVDDATVQLHIDALVTQLGGQDALNTWMAQYGYDENSFRQALRRSIAATWMRDQITSAVPAEVEQVHARQILLLSQDLANEVYAALEAGADFATQAYYYDSLTGGDLGWFPRRYLTQLSIEDAAFSLEVGQYSQVIDTDFGYHIIYVIDHQSSYPLTEDARLTLMRQALQYWIDQRRTSATVESLLP
ncbi:MAG TPA: peptidylprolyl isomerase, partial [Longilinea sp.]|nr:peptidylprolyl isomerase [Longilinea sp.]